MDIYLILLVGSILLFVFSLGGFIYVFKLRNKKLNETPGVATQPNTSMGGQNPVGTKPQTDLNTNPTMQSGDMGTNPFATPSNQPTTPQMGNVRESVDPNPVMPQMNPQNNDMALNYGKQQNPTQSTPGVGMDTNNGNLMTSTMDTPSTTPTATSNTDNSLGVAGAQSTSTPTTNSEPGKGNIDMSSLNLNDTTPTETPNQFSDTNNVMNNKPSTQNTPNMNTNPQPNNNNSTPAPSPFDTLTNNTTPPAQPEQPNPVAQANVNTTPDLGKELNNNNTAQNQPVTPSKPVAETNPIKNNEPPKPNGVGNTQPNTNPVQEPVASAPIPDMSQPVVPPQADTAPVNNTNPVNMGAQSPAAPQPAQPPAGQVDPITGATTAPPIQQNINNQSVV